MNVRLDRFALLITLALLAVNLATTARWTEVPGALHGWRLPYLAVALVVTAALAVRPPSAWRRLPSWLPRTVVLAGAVALAVFLFVDWFPPSHWAEIPMLDDWPPRFESTVEGLRLLRHGAFVGWQWRLLGGYATATDITQSLALVGAVPMALVGDAIGFHVLHVLLFVAVPVLTFLDLDRSESRALSLTAAGFTALATVGAGWAFIRSGDTNSLAGLGCVMLVFVASQRVRAGDRYGFSVLALALTLTAYSHVGFFLYAIGLLIVEAMYYGEGRHVHRSMLAGLVAVVLSLPLTYELFRYPAQFVANNVMFTAPPSIDWGGLVMKIAYNVQILFEPWRWQNDPGGLTSLFLPVVVLAAWRREGRIGFYGCSALFALLLMRFNVPQAGYLFARPVWLLVVFTPVAIAWFITSRVWDRLLATAIAVVAGLCFQITWTPLPHQPSVATYLPQLVDRVRAAPEPMVLVENNPHRDVVESPEVRSEDSYFGTHYEALLPDATGKRLYAGFWDGWQWTPFRGEMLAGGAWEGHLLTDDDHDAFVREMNRWGVRHLFVWSRLAQGTIDHWPEFLTVWTNAPWVEYELASQVADTRSVTTDHGEGTLESTNLLGGTVRLSGVAAGDRVTVRTHFHPAWQIAVNDRPVPAVDDHGQLSFIAPAAGSYDVTLIYPARRWLLFLAAAVLLGMIFIERHFAQT